MMTETIPFHDFGGDGPPLHFAHANAYPPACYRQFLQALTPHYHVLAMEQRPLWSPSPPESLTGWEALADDLIRFLEERGIQNVIGAGHSMGGVATMWAALKRPSLFSALVLIEPVFLPRHFLQLAKAHPDGASLTPLVQGAKRRRNQWNGRQEAFDRFRQKPVFKRFSDDALWDYVNHGLCEAEGGGFVLRYPREWEAQIYSMPPLTVWEDIPRVAHRTVGIRGAESDTIFPGAWALWRELQPDASFVEIADAGHMIPLERPFLLAKTIHQRLKTD